MITCKVCSTENPDGTQYCEGCGVELTPAASGTAPAETPVNPNPAPENVPAEAATPAEPNPQAVPAPPPEAPTEASLESVPTPQPEPSPAPAAFRTAKLTLKRFGALTSEVIPLQGERLVVGRFDASSGPVEIDLTGLPATENISRRHAELFFEQGQWKVRDLGSTNGVFIKRHGETNYSPRIAEPVAVAKGDELAFGNVIMLFEED